MQLGINSFIGNSIEWQMVYFLFLKPSKKISNDVFNLKKQAFTTLGYKIQESTLPHISLVQFLMLEKHEEELVKQCSEIVLKMNAVKFTPKKIDLFEGNTIHIALAENKQALNHSKNLIANLCMAGLVKNKSCKLIKPLHITILKTISDAEFLKTNFLLNQKIEQEEFICPQIVLCKSKTGEAPWKMIKVFDL